MSDAISVEDLDAAIEEYRSRGYRLDAIFPADNPREARVSLGADRALLKRLEAKARPPKGGTQNSPGWIRGRAGMEYRDLIPDRLGGKVIASHIRLADGGAVPDYVHYHKIDFQVIYCKRGRIKVVYEDQGEPFWLEAGDLVLQPPEIRHRVLECSAGAEVIEITSPAEHETWVEHELELPNPKIDPQRSFSGQRFFRYIYAADPGVMSDSEEKLAELARNLHASASNDEIFAMVTGYVRSLL